MPYAFDKLVDKSQRDKPLANLLKETPSALLGVTAADADALETSLGVRTVRGFASGAATRKALALLNATLPYDPGPPPDWARFFARAPLDAYRAHPDRFRLDFGPVYYRGRLDGTARLLLVGQDPSVNELLAQRIFVGSAGQRIQGFLNKLGLTRSYALLNAFLYSVFGQVNAELRAISLSSPLLDYRNAMLDRLARENPLQAVVTIGAGARHALEHWPGAASLPVVAITHPSARDEAALLANWNDALQQLLSLLTPDEGAGADPTPYGADFRPEDHASIPRHDLPFGLPDWHGVGSHGERDGNKTILWTAP